MDLTDYKDTTGTLLRVIRTYREKDANAAADHVIPPQFLPAVLQAPLSQFIDQFWSVTKDLNSNTARDVATNEVVKQIQDNGGAEIQGSFPLTGRLFALVSKRSFVLESIRHVVPILDLVYSLPGAVFTFKIGVPVIGRVGFRLTFDTSIEITIDVLEVPDPLTATAKTIVDNASVVPTDLVSVELAALDHLLGLDKIASIDRKINQEAALNVGPIGTLLSQVAPLLAQQKALGFSQMKVGIDASQGSPATVFLQLTHAGIRTPVVTNGPSVPGFQGPVLATNQTQVRAGEQLLVSGSFFTPLPATALNLEWEARGSASDIEVTPSNGPTQRLTTTIDRGRFTVTPVAPNTTFTVRVRDCELLAGPLSDGQTTTCSDFSAPITISTAAGNDVELALRSSSVNVVMATAPIGPKGTFSVTVTIPAGTAPGAYNLVAVGASGPDAHPTIQVLGPGTTSHPVLTVINPATNAPELHPGAVTEERVTVKGEGFQPGPVILTADTGAPLNTATAASNGSFTAIFQWPFNVVGNRRMIASQIVGGTRAQQASLDIFVQSLPH
jgi:hypothetical protein